ncbi:hypothetical protein A3709_02840 [Halioglobus sp. HI00S01]|uniref:VanZ family protein n=1 Tax=Halioglobus sp. HI00S01 TaxID=1822214 RepID=UPI0007C27440|nr:VanZ family protein [Halioglobus sp. HI00S01]KZX58414.1 hypothetical protein A3709_02840 [Halioglobus sp. HI00S01]
MSGDASISATQIFYRSRLWAVIWVYIGLTYATLPLMRSVLRALRDGVATETIGVLVNIALLLAAVALLALALRRGLLTAAMALIPLLAIAAIASQLEVAEERVHFLQYGLLGVLVVATGRHPGWRQWLVILAFVCAVGAIDELIQWGLPNRVGDWRDVAFNCTAGLLGTALGAVLYWLKPQRPGSNSTIS